jgi:segregation and condensation protein B
MSDFPSNEENRLASQLEALLFVADGPVTVGDLAECVGKKNPEVEKALKELDEYLQKEKRGIRLQGHASKVQLTSAPELAKLVENFLGLEATARFTRASLETLVIIAYKQPITRPGIDAIRGVNSDGVLKSLLSKGLIEEAGRTEGPGRPILFATTSDFLQHFGLSAIQELPPFEEESIVPPEQPNPVLKD